MPNSQSSISVTKTTVGRLMPLSVVLTCVAALLQLIGYLTPGWFVYVGEDSSRAIGLYYQRVCTSHNCRITEVIDAPVDMFDYQMEATLALVTCFITVVTLAKACWDCTIHPRLSVYLIAGCLCLISGILSFIASGKMAVNVINYHKRQPNRALFPYSLLLTGLGGLFASVDASVIMTIMYRLRHKRPSDSDDSESTVTNEYDMPRVWVTSHGQSVLPPYESHGSSTPPPYHTHGSSTPPPYQSEGHSTPPPYDSQGHPIFPPCVCQGQTAVPPYESEGQSEVPHNESCGPPEVPPYESRGSPIVPSYESRGSPMIPLNESRGQTVVSTYEAEGQPEVPPYESRGLPEVLPNESRGPTIISTYEAE